jgi:hypothetical protein
MKPLILLIRTKDQVVINQLRTSLSLTLVGQENPLLEKEDVQEKEYSRLILMEI